MIIRRLKDFQDQFCKWFISFHFKNLGKVDKEMIVMRSLSIIILFGYFILDTIVYSPNPIAMPDDLKFLYGSCDIGLEILVIIYASGSSAFGISVEIYAFIPYGIINCILVTQNCSNSTEINAQIVWIVKLSCLFLAVELIYRNFRKLNKYDENFILSARTMLRQAQLFSITTLFFNVQAFRALYDGINTNLPRLCIYSTSCSNLINLYQPLFSYDDDKCLDDLTGYVVGREVSRISRNFLLFNVASYSIFNKNFVEINHNAKYFPLRTLLVLIFLALTTSVIVATIDPFVFINKCRVIYNIIECITFAIILILLAYNLYNLRKEQMVTIPTHISLDYHRTEPMDPSPKILSTF